ncbi:MAG: purine-nucleoside phosphorylase [Selenomonadales bacterium]|nr:purine-nucleoside phosphorylase [Selenomonadales bacterium]MDD6219248.1 purine-nucleoside phosphorylase [Selenomonadaceae bacterium]
MMSLHIEAKPGEIADRILLPGDPLRAKYIAENFFEDAKQYTGIRNILGFTGTYKGKRVSVQGTGMGIPSISIYAHELIHDYNVKKLVRVGTCGAMHKSVKLRDVVIAQATSTDSSIIRNIFGNINYAPIADYELLTAAVESAKNNSIPVKVGNVISVDRFYDDDIDNSKLTRYGIIAVEMEAAALYTLAAEAGVQALALFTASDHLVTGERCTTEERQTSFTDMMKVALDAIIKD